MLLAPDILYIDARVRGLPATQRLLSHFPSAQTELITDISSMHIPDDFARAKRQWLITQTTKKWYHQMTQDNGTMQLSADFITNVPYDCSYSPFTILHARRPFLTLFVNLEEVLADLGRRCAEQPGRQIVVRCGERGDALALDHVTHASEVLVPFFAWTPNARLELWTRTANIGHIRSLPHHGRTTITFAVTPQCIIDREERDTASLADRLAAAHTLAEQGFRVAYSIDPVIQYDGWEADYEALIDAICTHTPTQSLARIELSCFHYPRGLATQSMERFPDSRIFYGELVPVNGCYRYFRPVRQHIYEHLSHAIRQRAEHCPITITNEHGMMAAQRS